MNLTTTYLGMKLRTPLVPSASPLSEDLDKIKKMEQAGASAVVLHSLFEEQTEVDVASNPEFRIGPKVYLEHIRRAKSSVKIPIIASLNCTTLGGWLSYTRQITETDEDVQVTFYLTDAHEMNWVTEFLDSGLFNRTETEKLFRLMNATNDVRGQNVGRFRVDFDHWQPRHTEIFVFSFTPVRGRG
jgi:hypothetical protein